MGNLQEYNENWSLFEKSVQNMGLKINTANCTFNDVENIFIIIKST